MSSDKYPKELSNAERIISNVVRKKSSFVKKSEKIYDFLSQEPLTISIKKEENSETELFTRIIRVRIWNWENKNISWNVFSKDRESFRDLIVRRVVWNLGIDSKKKKKQQ